MIEISKPDNSIKFVFNEYFSSNGTMPIGDMFLRLYDPLYDLVIQNYSEEEWHLIFSNINEDNLKDLNTCVNVVILLWCDIVTGNPHGMVFLEEDYNKPSEVAVHGGTWNHTPKYYQKIFHSIIYLFDFLFKYKATIKTSCRISNIRADKFLRSLCFEETRRDELFSYKTLDKQVFEESFLINRMRLVSL